MSKKDTSTFAGSIKNCQHINLLAGKIYIFSIVYLTGSGLFSAPFIL